MSSPTFEMRGLVAGVQQQLQSSSSVALLKDPGAMADHFRTLQSRSMLGPAVSQPGDLWADGGRFS